jgi:hypothetical protein
MNHTGGRPELRHESACSSNGSVTVDLRKQIADAANAADHARIGGIELDQFAQPHDEIIDRT